MKLNESVNTNTELAEVGVERNRIKTLLVSIKDKVDEFKVKMDKYNSYSISIS